MVDAIDIVRTIAAIMFGCFAVVLAHEAWEIITGKSHDR